MDEHSIIRDNINELSRRLAREQLRVRRAKTKARSLGKSTRASIILSRVAGNTGLTTEAYGLLDYAAGAMILGNVGAAYADECTMPDIDAAREALLSLI